MEAEGINNPPLWAEPAYNQRRHSRHSRRYVVGMYTFILSPVALVPALLVSVVLISYIPSFLSPFSFLLRRVLLFKSWDAFNFVLVLFAILAGILSRNSSATGAGHHQQEEGDQFASKLFEFARTPDDARIQREEEGRELPSRFYESKLDESRLLVKEVTPRSKEAWFSGDHNGQKSEGLDSMGDRSLVKTPQSKEAAILFHDNNDQKNERLDPMNDQSPVEYPRRDSQSPDFERFAGRDDALMCITHSSSPPPTSPQLPLPLPLPPPQPRVAEEKVKRNKHRSKDASMAFASVISRKKDRKKKKNKSSEHVAAEIPAHLPESRPPSICHHLFTNLKETKIQKPRVHSAPVSIPPPPTPLHLAPTKKTEKPRKENVGIQDSDSPVTFPPPLPPLPSPVIRAKEKHKMEISSISSSNSSGRPLPPLLPPPPPPPLASERPAERVIVMENKYVTKRSDSKREYQAGKSENVSGTSLFCPSPDVNVKADKFIAKVREGMMLEKIQAMREKKQRHAKR